MGNNIIKKYKNVTEIPLNCCYGCGACVSACPNKCLHLGIGVDGFYYPQIIKSGCSNCAQCITKCIAVSKKYKKEYILTSETYGCQHLDAQVRYNSSSGGIFYSLARYVLNNRGIVYAAVYDYNKVEVLHKRSETMDNIKQFMKSKYVQSNIGNSYQLVQDDLVNNRLVLFVGTPCQIDGLLSFLSKDYPNLYTIDLICKGVPSPKFFYDYFKSLSKGKKIDYIDFRSKVKGWGSWRKLYFEYKISGEKHLKHSLFSLYYTMFISNASLRKTCYKCPYSSVKRIGDLTLGDFWGVNKSAKYLNDGTGISTVMINSLKGKVLFEKIKGNLSFKSFRIEDCMQHNFKYPTKEPKLFRKIFLKVYTKYNGLNTFSKIFMYLLSLTQILFNKIRNVICHD